MSVSLFPPSREEERAICPITSDKIVVWDSKQAMEELEANWYKLKLDAKEQLEINIQEENCEGMIEKENRSVIGKILSNRYLSKEVIHSTMLKI